MAQARTDETIEARLEATDFAADELRIRRVTGREKISTLFDFELEVVAPDEGIDAARMLGAVVTVVFTGGAVELRRIHGMIIAADDLLAGHERARVYRLRIAPRAHRLALVETQDVFLNLSVPEIIQSKLGLVDLLDADVELRLNGTYPAREFVVQYQETDLAFVSRLAEHLGISFFFEHRDGRDVIVFSDHAAAFLPVPGAESAPFQAQGDERHVYELAVERKLVPRFFAVRDYNYRTPLASLAAEHVLETGLGGVVEYGGHFKTEAEGRALALVRAEERQAGETVFVGRSDLVGLTAGAKLRVEGHPNLPATSLLVVEVEHEATLTVGGFSAGAPRTYENRFRAIPAERTYRPTRVTPRPKIAGLVGGVIDAGPQPGATTAQIDEDGRYFVRFLFDNTPRDGQAPSRRIRMAQQHVGENYGTHYPLRPDTEVVIGFIDGDPDRPIIVGAVPNAVKPSPVDHRNPTVHRVRTASGITIDIQDGR